MLNIVNSNHHFAQRCSANFNFKSIYKRPKVQLNSSSFWKILQQLIFYCIFTCSWILFCNKLGFLFFLSISFISFVVSGTISNIPANLCDLFIITLSSKTTAAACNSCQISLKWLAVKKLWQDVISALFQKVEPVGERRPRGRPRKWVRSDLWHRRRLHKSARPAQSHNSDSFLCFICFTAPENSSRKGWRTAGEEHSASINKWLIVLIQSV